MFGGCFPRLRFLSDRNGFGITLQVYEIKRNVPKVAFCTLGCRLNFSESSALAREFSRAGFEVVGFEQEADVYVVNTCTVTAAAEKKCRQAVRQAHRTNPRARIAVVGCFSQLRPEEAAALAGVDWVLGTEDKHALVARIRDSGCFPGSGKGDIPGKEGGREGLQPGGGRAEGAGEKKPGAPWAFVPSYSTLGRTRSFFKVQDGCDNFCSYCAIPYARGRSRSLDIAGTLEIAREIASCGVKEIVLTGVNIGDFGKAHGESLLGLLSALDALEGVERVRIGSVEPDLLTDDIISLVAGSRILMPHFHLPLQSGNDEVLKRMNRRYDRACYASRVEKIRQMLPDAFIACDLIVGFPTETAGQFEDSFDFVSRLDLSALHVFSYSDRAEAAASRLKPVCSPSEKASRSARMHALSDRKKAAFYRRFENSVQEVLWESDEKGGHIFGYTPNYLKVMHEEDSSWVNSLREVRVGKAVKDACKDWCLES